MDFQEAFAFYQTLPLSNRFETDREPYPRIGAGVENGSPDEKAGLSSGDIILKADGTKTGGIDKLLLMFNAGRIGEETDITVFRKGEVFERMLNPVEKRT